MFILNSLDLHCSAGQCPELTVREEPPAGSVEHILTLATLSQGPLWAYQIHTGLANTGLTHCPCPFGEEKRIKTDAAGQGIRLVTIPPSFLG